MKCIEEVVKIWDECVIEIFKGEILDEEDKLDLELAREVMVANLVRDDITKKDEEFILSNLGLYKRLMLAILSQDEKEIKLVILEMLKIRNIG